MSRSASSSTARLRSVRDRPHACRPCRRRAPHGTLCWPPPKHIERDAGRKRRLVPPSLGGLQHPGRLEFWRGLEPAHPPASSPTEFPRNYSRAAHVGRPTLHRRTPTLVDRRCLQANREPCPSPHQRLAVALPTAASLRSMTTYFLNVAAFAVLALVVTAVSVLVPLLLDRPAGRRRPKVSHSGTAAYPNGGRATTLTGRTRSMQSSSAPGQVGR